MLPLWRIHRHIGMGGDQLVAALAGEEFEAEHGDDVRAAEKVLYMALIDEVRPLAGARELIEDLKGRGHAVVLASSAKPDEVEHYLDLLDARELADDWTDSGDVEKHQARARPRRRGDREGRRRAGGDGRRLDLGLRGGRARRHPDGRRADRRLQRGRAARGRRGLRVRVGRQSSGADIESTPLA